MDKSLRVTASLLRQYIFSVNKSDLKELTASWLTHYSPVLLFYTPQEYQKTLRFSDVFRLSRKTTPGCNGLKLEMHALDQLQ